MTQMRSLETPTPVMSLVTPRTERQLMELQDLELKDSNLPTGRTLAEL